MNPIFHKNYVPKPMLMAKRLQMIDSNRDGFKDLGCKHISVKSRRYCKNNTLVTRYVC